MKPQHYYNSRSNEVSTRFPSFSYHTVARVFNEDYTDLITQAEMGIVDYIQYEQAGFNVEIVFVPHNNEDHLGRSNGFKEITKELELDIANELELVDDPILKAIFDCNIVSCHMPAIDALERIKQTLDEIDFYSQIIDPSNPQDVEKLKQKVRSLHCKTASNMTKQLYAGSVGRWERIF